MISKESFEEYFFYPTDFCIVNFSFDSDFGTVFDFAIIYLHKEENNLLEIVRFDCSNKESFHMHQFYFSSKEEKRFIQKELSFETIEWCLGELREKWFKYKLAFDR
ncbi:MAG: hypothetical protein WC821_03585 [archaeon]|jgi:hypothetical protein